MARLLKASRVGLAGNTPRYVRYLEDFPAFPLTNLWNDTRACRQFAMKRSGGLHLGMWADKVVDFLEIG